MLNLIDNTVKIFNLKSYIGIYDLSHMINKQFKYMYYYSTSVL